MRRQGRNGESSGGGEGQVLVIMKGASGTRLDGLERQLGGLRVSLERTQKQRRTSMERPRFLSPRIQYRVILPYT